MFRTKVSGPWPRSFAKRHPVSVGKALLVIGSLTIVTMAAVAVWGGPILPMPGLIGVGALYFALLAWGSLSPRLEMYGDVLWFWPSAIGKVALTFDDGPDPVATPIVLDLLARHGARATFFTLGSRALAHPELLVRMVNEGHTIGLHSYDHNRLYAFLRPDEVQADIERCRRIVEDACGVRAVWFRPPVGQMSPRTAAGVRRAGAETVGWSARGRDGLARTTALGVIQRLTPALKSGAILLLHDAWERSPGASTPPAGVLALPQLLDLLAERNLQAVTVDELILANGSVTTNRAPGE